ncbi:galactose oxidase [Boletus reticuloceps]|uniref:Galactose oxidase n=2 Tax=Boletus TaxID=5369 RepID=A0A8I3A3W4_9AGAM|nr:galactose oxidase [Boletus reticuloceps]
MAKGKPGAASSKKAAAKAQKKAKATQKTTRKEKRKATKSQRDNHDQDDGDQDLEDILEQLRQEWEAAHTVTEELVEGPPSRRVNATLTACPNGNHIWCIGGEYFSEDGKAYFYNDVFRYSPDKDEWRKFVSQTCPGPRSAHSVVASPAGGGKLYLFGGEFSSLYQNSFHHYRDFWVFDIPTHTWERIETKARPSARSGHRMTIWKHFIVLFGGFYDPGYRTQYLNDTWIFDTQEYKWRQIEFKEPERKPSPRSGFSLLPTTDGIVLHGGYCKEYTKGKRPVGVILDDTWFLKMTLSPSLPSPLVLKWEKRKTPSSTHKPTARAGCTMALWSAKGTGVMFGGVTDEEQGDEGLESEFWNDLYGYQLGGNGRWIAMHLKKPKTKSGSGKKKQAKASGAILSTQDLNDHEEEDGEDGETQTRSPITTRPKQEDEIDSDDPNLTRPVPRYNAMLAVLRNTLYIYGGIFELGTREYTLDDFYTLQLDKLERFVCLKPSGVVIPTEAEESSDEEGESGEEGSDDDEDEDDEDSEGETTESEEKRSGKERGKGKEKKENRRKAEESEDEVEADVDATAKPEPETGGEAGKQGDLRAQATAFMGVSVKDATRSAEDVISTPVPGETLAMFYSRSRMFPLSISPLTETNVCLSIGEYWAQKAHQDLASDNRGKQLRRDGFGLAEARYRESVQYWSGSWSSHVLLVEYKPVLEEVEKILAEAGLDEDEMKMQGARDTAGQSRNPTPTTPERSSSTFTSTSGTLTAHGHAAMPPELEQTLALLSSHRSVLGYLLLSRGDQVSIIRHSGVVFEGEQGRKYASVIGRIVENVQAGLEEISGEENDGDHIRFMRIRTKRHELMISPDDRFLLAVLHDPAT